MIETPAQQGALIDALGQAAGEDQPALPIEDLPAETLLLAEVEIEIEAEAAARLPPSAFEPPIPAPVDAEAAPDEADTTAAPSGTRP